MKTLLVSAAPRTKMLLASGLLLGLAALAPLEGLSVTAVARGLLGAMVLVGLGVWLMRHGRVAPGLRLPERLLVVSRTGLSPRCGLALVQVDGSHYLVAYGDSFAEIRRTEAKGEAS